MGERRLGLLVLATTLGLASVARTAEHASGGVEPTADVVTVTLKDGGTLVGTVVAEDEGWLTLRTRSGAELRVPREAIAIRGPAPAADAKAVAAPRSDPNESRLMFAPTGRPLGKGNGYFSDHYVLFPGFAYGLTKNLSLAGGFSAIPAVSLDEQVFYVSASAGFDLGRSTSFAIGGFVAGSGGGGDLDGGAALFGVASFGPPDRSLSLGVAALAEREREYAFGPRGEYQGESSVWRFRDAPVVMIGGSLRLSRSVALISESWLFLGKDFDLSEQPFGFALRFFGGRLSADVGLVLVKEVLEEGFPVPWLSFSYHFGPSRRSAARSGQPALPAWARAGTGSGR